MAPEDRARLARQIALPEIGVVGQMRLAEIAVVGGASDPRVARWAEDHATRAGAGAGASSAAPAGATVLSDATADDVRRLAGRAELEETAAFLLGALAALDHVRRTVLPGPIEPTRSPPLADPGRDPA